MPTRNFGYGPTLIGFRLSGWRAALALGLVLAVMAGIMIFALGLLLVLVPVLLVASATYFFLGGKRRNFVSKKKEVSEDIIDGEFRVVETASDDTNPIRIQIGSVSSDG